MLLLLTLLEVYSGMAYMEMKTCWVRSSCVMPLLM